jgi:5-methylcytosine-specific restriction endonuclease McrA
MQEVIMQNKTCTKCLQVFPATVKYFFNNFNGNVGLSQNCKTCEIESYKDACSNKKDIGIQNNIENYKKYKEELKEQSIKRKKQLYLENIDARKEYEKQYRKANAEKIRKQNKQWRIDNAEKLKERERQRYLKSYDKDKRKKYYEENKERYKLNGKIYYKNNLNRKRECGKQYRLNNRDKIAIVNQKRRAIKKQLPYTLTITQWNTIKKHFNNSCAYCGKKSKLEQEHFIPLSKGGGYTECNIIPACRSCNSSKQDTYFYQWYPSHEHYNKQREQKIYDYLESVKGTKQLSLI